MSKTIALLGTGTMGAPMAENLAKAGFTLHVWNRTRERAQAVASEISSISAAASPREAADGANFILTMLTDGEAVEAAVSGQDGALAAARGGTIWLQMSTVGLAVTEQLAALAGEHDVKFVDAPVSGTKQPAELGELIVLASGPEDGLQAAQPVFEAVGSKTVRCGPAGAGTRLKLVLNAWLVALIESLAETIAVAEALDVDPQQFLDTIGGGPLGPAYAQLKGKMMISRDFPASFALRHAHKDATLVLDAIEGTGIEAPLIEVVARQMERAIASGHGDEDMAATICATIDC